MWSYIFDELINRWMFMRCQELVKSNGWLPVPPSAIAVTAVATQLRLYVFRSRPRDKCSCAQSYWEYKNGSITSLRILLYSYTPQDPAMQDVIDQVAALYDLLEDWKVNKAGVITSHCLPSAHEKDDISTDISDVETEDGRMVHIPETRVFAKESDGRHHQRTVNAVEALHGELRCSLVHGGIVGNGVLLSGGDSVLSVLKDRRSGEVRTIVINPVKFV